MEATLNKKKPIPQWIDLPAKSWPRRDTRKGGGGFAWIRRTIHMREPHCGDHRMTIMCRRATERSQGQLLDLNLAYFGDDDMLNCIVHRSCRLTLLCCNLISGKGLAEAAKKLAHLEELHPVVTQLDQPSDIKTIGISCPKLKSFTFNQHISKRLPSGNKCALAIARNMPNVRHLRLFDEPITNEALQLILDGCPNLKSLDLRRCFDLDLRGPLGKTCDELIQDLKRPFDFINDDEWLETSVNSTSRDWLSMFWP